MRLSSREHAHASEVVGGGGRWWAVVGGGGWWWAVLGGCGLWWVTVGVGGWCTAGVRPGTRGVRPCGGLFPGAE